MRRKQTDMVRRATQWIPLWPRDKGKLRKVQRDVLEKRMRTDRKEGEK